jgi:hypothetical protein
MRFLALFGVLIGEGAMMVHPQPPIKMGREITAVRMPTIFSSPRQPEHARRAVRDRGVRMFPYQYGR